MNQWHVYEHMKKHYMQTGKVLTESDLRRDFPRLDKREIREGIEEFKATTNEKVMV